MAFQSPRRGSGHWNLMAAAQTNPFFKTFVD